MTKFKPLVAIGAEEPLQDRVENADYFRMSIALVHHQARDRSHWTQMAQMD